MLIEESLDELKEEIREMAGRSLAIFDKAVEMLHSRDASVLSEVKDMDKVIDSMEMKLDRHCMALLLKEPYGMDFRYIFSTVKTIGDLERVGDQCKTIAKWSLKLDGDLPQNMDELVKKSKEAILTAIEALLETDAEKARKVLELEFQVDDLEDKIIQSNKCNIAEAFIAKALEKIGDIATNIGENVIFNVDATDIRHGGFK